MVGRAGSAGKLDQKLKISCLFVSKSILLVDGSEDIVLDRDQRDDFLAGYQPDLIGGEDIQRILHRHLVIELWFIRLY